MSQASAIHSGLAREARRRYLAQKSSRIQKTKRAAAEHLEERHRNIEQLIGVRVTPQTAASIHELWNVPPPPPPPEPSFDEMGRLTAAGHERITRTAYYEGGSWSEQKLVYRV